MAETNDEAWYEKLWGWLGNTATTYLDSNLKGKQAKYEAELAAQQAQLEADNNTLSFFGKELHKDTILWIAGGALVAVLILVIAKRR